MHNVIMLNNIQMFISSSDVAVETSKQNRPEVALSNNRDGGIPVTPSTTQGKIVYTIEGTIIADYSAWPLVINVASELN